MKITEKTACFTGHRDIPADKVEYIKNELHREIGEAVAAGYEHFISGFAEGVDLLAAEIVLELKKDWPGLTLEAAIPYPNRLTKLMKSPGTKAILGACSGIGVWSESYHPDCFMVRNRKMLSLSSRLIAVYDGREKGGTLQTMRFAHVQEIEVREIRI